MSRLLVQFLFIGSLLLLATAHWKQYELPQYPLLRKELMREPEQIPIAKAGFDTTVNGVTYYIRPLYTYDIYGLVVSQHDAKTWWDYLHREWNDHLNVMDLCVVWGNNLRRGVYKEATYSSGQFECFVRLPTREINDVFDKAAMSNNHLLTDRPEIAQAIRKARVGDQVHFRGYLAEYAHNYNGHPFSRGTSIVRTDTGNGACETVFIENFEILRTGDNFWPAVKWIAGFLLAASMIAWLRLPLGRDI